jgi:hypothetical protein
MSIPSSQIASVWLQEELETTTWVPLKEILFKAARRKLVGLSDEEVWDYVEVNFQYVAEHLRDEVSECQIDGATPTFEIDSEQLPYIRRTASLPSDVIAKLRKIDPFQLETICGASLLKRHELAADGRIGPLTPVLYAFWTTSDFDPNAKKFARQMGLWYMDGLTLATYVNDLTLKGFVMALPDNQNYGTKVSTTQVEAVPAG